MATETVSRSGIYVSWPAIAVVAAMVLSLVTGAIQLGGVQTYVVINTKKLENIDDRERSTLERIAKIEARQQMNEERIKMLEVAGPVGRIADTVVIDRLGKIEARLSSIETKMKSEQ